MGCVIADMRQDFVQTVNRLLDQIDAEALGREMTAVADETEALLAGTPASISPGSIAFRTRHALSRPDPYGECAGRDPG
jgi:N-methylhydantoinase A